MTSHKIDKFTGKYRFLSNFYPCYIPMDGLVYWSVEAAYQASKTLDVTERKSILDTCFISDWELAARAAKRMGKEVTKRLDWDDIKLDVMYWLLQKKYGTYPLSDMLLETGDSLLEEGNTYGDTFWGTVDGKGDNYLGRLLVIVREELQDDLRIPIRSNCRKA